MNKAQVIRRLGEPSAMEWGDWPLPDPGEGEVQIKHTAVGVNYADTYHRSGIPHPWPVPNPPVVIGFEGVGIVQGIGKEVIGFKEGDRVAYGIPPLGSYSEARNYPANKLLQLPEDLEEKKVAALLMKGMTAHYLLHRTYKVKTGDVILVHAAAGGMGLLAQRVTPFQRVDLSGHGRRSADRRTAGHAAAASPAPATPPRPRQRSAVPPSYTSPPATRA